ncbi:MAG: exodeoxyribonuclease VII small subunit [Eggerthellaceae bacterium]|jgi:exodeoxyribonuclease VII small subunit
MAEEATNAPKDIEQMTFREAMDELGQIVTSLEDNSLELEESLKRYERGVALLRSLRARLDGAQQKVDQLMGELEQVESDEEIDSGLHKA